MSRREQAAGQKKAGGWGEALRTLVWAGVIALGVRTVAYEPFNIPSGSMIPSLLIGDYLFVSKFAYGYSRHSMFGLPLFSGRIFGSAPERGDVVVFNQPVENKTFIKRIIGLPGDRIQVRDGLLHINGAAVKRERTGDYRAVDYHVGRTVVAPMYVETLPNGVRHSIIEVSGDNGLRDNTPEYLVPPDSYFAMGDNRDDSADSRDGWVVPAENLIGKAQFLFFSTDGRARLWEFWMWPAATRWSRLFDSVD